MTRRRDILIAGVISASKTLPRSSAYINVDLMQHFNETLDWQGRQSENDRLLRTDKLSYIAIYCVMKRMFLTIAFFPQPNRSLGSPCAPCPWTRALARPGSGGSTSTARWGLASSSSSGGAEVRWMTRNRIVHYHMHSKHAWGYP